MKKVVQTLFLITMFSGIVLSSSIVFADNDNVVDEINITVPVSCTLSGIGMGSHNATINNGQYDSAIGETTLQAFCNDTNGFAIYAIGYTDDIDGKNVLTNSGLDSTYDIVTGLATSGNISNWAMKLSAVTSPIPTYPIIIAGSSFDTLKEQGDPDFTAFQEVPNNYEKVAYRTAGTDMGSGAEGSTFKTTYQAYISSIQPAGTYTGQVKYILLHPASADAPEVSISIEDAYARAGKQKLNGYYKMQEMSDLICSMVTLYDESSQTQLIDMRDNKVYYVAKLQDGNCWMTQNLDHDIVTIANYYTNENTDIGWDSSTNSYNTATWTAEYSTHTSGDEYWCDESKPDDGSVCSFTSVSSYDPGNNYWNGEFSSDYNDNRISVSGDTHYHLGNYYNWNAAVATNDSSSMPEDTLMERSICPAGWTLPRAGIGDDSFYSLLDNYGFTDSSIVGDDAIWGEPLYLGLLGSISSNRLVAYKSVGNQGGYWSAVFSNWDQTMVGYAYNLYFTQDFIDIDGIDGGGLSIGKSVRCVARPVSDSFVSPW